MRSSHQLAMGLGPGKVGCFLGGFFWNGSLEWLLTWQDGWRFCTGKDGAQRDVPTVTPAAVLLVGHHLVQHIDGHQRRRLVGQSGLTALVQGRLRGLGMLGVLKQRVNLVNGGVRRAFVALRTGEHKDATTINEEEEEKGVSDATRCNA